MSETPLKTWINETIHLSKKITNLTEDFRNGYFFGEILSKMRLIPNFSSYKNSNTHSDISKNYQYLSKAFQDLNIKFSDSRRNDILNRKPGVVEQMLFKIKQALDIRFISNETLAPKASNELAKMYKRMYYPNENEKYLRDYYNSLGLGKKKLDPLHKFGEGLSKYDKNIINEIDKDNEYIKEKHMEKLNEIRNKEKLKEENFNKIEEENLKNWKDEMIIKKNFEEKKKKQFWAECEYYKKAVLRSFDKSSLSLINQIKTFEETLSRLGLDIVDNNKKNDKKNYVSTEIIMRKIQEKIKFEEKARKDKAKRMRKIKNEQKKMIEIKKEKENKIEVKKIDYDEEIKKLNDDYNNKLDEFNRIKKLHQHIPLDINIIEEEKNKEEEIPKKEGFDSELFFTQLDKYSLKMFNDLVNHKKNKKDKIRPFLDDIMNMILEITDESSNYLETNNCELIEIPYWQEWMNLFKDNIHLSEYIKNKENSLNNQKEYNPNEIEIEDVENQDYLNNELYDYITFLGNWTIDLKKILLNNKNKINNTNSFSSKSKENVLEMNLYEILGNDITFMLNGGKFQMNGLKEKELLMMKNSEFEPGTLDITNVTLPVNNIINPILGEIISFYIDMKYDIINDNKETKKEEKKVENENDEGVIKEDKEEIENKEESNNINKDLEKNVENNNIQDENENKKEEEKKEENKENEENKEENKEKKEENKENEEEKKEIINTEVEDIFSDGYTLNHIPLKLCFVGHEFSGRKTQSNLISSTYPTLKVYNMSEIIKSSIEEYEKIMTPIEDNPKFKSMKKNQIEALEQEKEKQLNEFAYVKSIIEPLAKKEIENLSDENYINLLIYHIKKDFPVIKKEDIQNEINSKREKLKNIDIELEKIKEEQIKKPNAKKKEEQQFLKDKENLQIESYKGFILIDFPKTLEQFKLFEKKCTGFEVQLDKPKTEKENEKEILLHCIDNLYHTDGKKIEMKSIFDRFLFFELNEEETLRRTNNRKIDPKTGIIYHLEDNPPPENDKKLIGRLEDVTEPNEEKVKEMLSEYFLNIVKIKDFINLFKNEFNVKISKDKEEIKESILKEIDVALNEFEVNLCGPVLKPEENQNNEENAQQENNNNNNNNNNSNIINEENNNKEINNLNQSTSHNINQSSNNLNISRSQTIRKKVNSEEFNINTLELINSKYKNRYFEAKRLLQNSNINALFLTKWSKFIPKYNKTLKESFLRISNIKKHVIEYTVNIQKDFIEFLNQPSEKKDLIDIFTKKYSTFKSQFHQISNNPLVIKEFNNDLNDLADGIWAIINQRKVNAINERKNLISKNFFGKQIEYFYENFIKLFEIEVEKFLLSLNIIKEFYYGTNNELLKATIPFTAQIEEIKSETILKNTENLNLMSKDEINNQLFYPKLEKIFCNCIKIIFKFDFLVKQIESAGKSNLEIKESNVNSLNTSSNPNDISVTKSQGTRKKKLKIKSFKQEIDSSKEIFENSEANSCIENEKIKFKYRIMNIKQYCLNILNNLNKISNDIFNNLDEWIIDSVHYQNNMMNALMERLRKIVKNNLKVQWDFELDKFNVYKPINVKFHNNYLNIEDYESDFDLKDINYLKYINLLNKSYKMIKLFTIQNEFISINNFTEILIKKFISPLILDYQDTPLFKLSFHKLNNLFNLLLPKENEKGRGDIININHAFTLLALLPFKILDETVYNEMYDNIKDKLINHCFLNKNDFNEIEFWFEEEKIFKDAEEEKQIEKEDKINLKEFLEELYINEENEINFEDLMNIVRLKTVNVEEKDKIYKYCDLMNEDSEEKVESEHEEEKNENVDEESEFDDEENEDDIHDL